MNARRIRRLNGGPASGRASLLDAVDDRRNEMVDLAGKDIISAAELSPDEILHIVETARQMEKVAGGE